MHERQTQKPNDETRSRGTHEKYNAGMLTENWNDDLTQKKRNAHLRYTRRG